MTEGEEVSEPSSEEEKTTCGQRMNGPKLRQEIKSVEEEEGFLPPYRGLSVALEPDSAVLYSCVQRVSSG